MKPKSVTLLWTMLLSMVSLTSAMATDEITCSNFSINRGETKTFGIQLSNAVTNYVGFQMDLTLPEGLTVNKVGCSLSNRITDENQELTIGKQGENIYRLTSTSFSLTPISGTSGDLITVSVTASNTYQSGNATISNILFATSNSEQVTMSNVALGISIGIISFADANVKALCVAHWDTNGDGELDYGEAAAVTDLGQVFYYNSIITSFNELQYFTGLTSIGDDAFFHCPWLSSITIPNSVTSIGRHAFCFCSGLTSITIPNSVTSIGEAAFCFCSGLTSITIPNSVTSIGDCAFSGCSGLTSIIVDSNNTVYDSRDNCNAIIEKATNTLIAGCQNTVIPNGVTSIGKEAFRGCSDLTSITIPNSVTSIGIRAFSGCSGLTSVTIPNSVTSIGDNAFYWCSDLTSITIPNSVTSIGDYVFIGCSGLTSIIVDSNNTVYDSRDNCNAIIEKDINTLIAGCKNTIIPNSVTSIGHGAFGNCFSLTSITIPNSVTSIGDDAFAGCSDLTSITIPNSVTSIGECAFEGCSGLTSVILNISSPLSIYSSTFSNCANATLYVPAGAKPAYQAATYWKDFKAIKEFPDPDVNQDGSVNVVDVVDVARFVIGTPSESFDQFLADLNGSGEVNVADAVVLVNEIAGDVNWSRPLHAPAISDGILTLTRNADQSLSFSLEDNRAYTAFQFDLMMPEGMDVTQLTLNSERKQNHQLLYNKISDGHYRVVALSTSDRSFNGTTGELLNIAFDSQPTDGIVIDNIHFVTTQGSDLLFNAIGISGDTPTSISGVRNDATPINGIIYNLNGQRLTKAQKGLYIINGKKVNIK